MGQTRPAHRVMGEWGELRIAQWAMGNGQWAVGSGQWDNVPGVLVTVK